MRTENVAMWMLYSKNNGYMMNLTNKIVMNTMNCNEVEIVRLNESKSEVKEIIETLYRDKFEIKIMDVLYYEKNVLENCFIVEHLNESNRKLNMELIDEKEDCFIKSRPWAYEKECRIIVSVKKLRNLKIDKNVYVKVPINPSHIEKLINRIYHSPNSKNNDEYKPSKLHGKIEWDLCKDCKYKKIKRKGKK